MKKIVLFVCASFALLLAGCFEITDEITVNKDGSGTITSVTDMSMLLSMAKTMGGGNMPSDEKAIDSTISLAKMADSLSSLSAEEKGLLKNGKLTLKINMGEEKMLTKMEMPFTNLEQIGKIKALATKMTSYFLGKSAGSAEGMPPGLDEKISSSDPTNEYFTTTYAKGVIEKKLNKEKYATVENDEGMKAIKEMSDNGMPISTTIVLNLPSPAKTTTGKGITLSEDKKKVTIKTSSEDFFDNASAMEFKIEY